MPKGSYQIAEVFWSIQGEGANAGDTAIFLRLQGCPVGCSWCDSKPTWYGGGTEMSVQEIISTLRGLPRAEWIVVTGGEPLIWDLDDLFTGLRQEFKTRLQIETSGAFPYKGEQRPDWTCLSPKYPVQYRVSPNALRVAGELKYVVDEHFSPQVVARHMQQFREDSGKAFPRYPLVYLMPEGSPPRREMVDRTIDLLRQFHGWRFGPRLQYDYPTITEGEGRNNAIIDRSTAKATSRARRLERDSAAEPPPVDGGEAQPGD